MGPTSNDGWQPANTWPDLLNKRYAGMGCAVLGTKLVVAGGSSGGSAVAVASAWVALHYTISLHKMNASNAANLLEHEES